MQNHTRFEIHENLSSRRQFLTTMGMTAAAVWLMPRRLLAEDQGSSPVSIIRGGAAAAKITTTHLRGGVSVLDGAGGNIAVLAGRDGKLLVDAGVAGSRPALSEALAVISADPVRQLINTHWHFDHTDGNEWVHSAGAEITAHENTRLHLSKSTRVDGWNFTFPPAPAGALPSHVFAQKHALTFNGTTIRLEHYAPSHTDSDLSVKFHEPNILHTGDTWWNGHYPFIDYSTGGSLHGSIQAAETNIAKANRDTIVIPGHGPVGGKVELTEFRDMLVTIRDRVAALKQKSRSLAEVVAAAPTADFDAKWGGFVINGKTFTSLVYAGV